MFVTVQIRRVDDRGSVVIPRVIRNKFEISPGDDLEFYIKSDCVVFKK